MTAKKFDLNIEEILENWDASDGIRELIANALDEQKITDSKPIEISQTSENTWHIRDYGRGLQEEHLTQKENPEKLDHPHLIGKFGIGLKDALATFDRKKIKICFRSKHLEFTTAKLPKQGFENLLTLHALISPPSDPNFAGTEVILENVRKEDVEKAKSLFLMFSGDSLLEETPFGEVLEKNRDPANIYVNGVKVAEEENFLFSYNITSLTASIKRALNRERTNVGRNAYSDRVKNILLKCTSEEIAGRLMKDLEARELGRSHDELNWIDIQEHAVKILNAKHRNIVFMTSYEQQTNFKWVDEAQSRGMEIITIPDSLKNKISKAKDLEGNMIRDMDELILEDHRSFEFRFVSPSKLKSREREIWNLQDRVFDLIGGRPRKVREIKISETMRHDPNSFQEALGLWDDSTNSIIIKRDQLKSLKDFAGTLIHESVHALSGTGDVTQSFEKALTIAIGTICSNIIYDK